MKELGKIKAVIAKYKFILIVIAAGLLLLALPSFSGSEETDAPSASAVSGEEDFSVSALEEKLSSVLSEVEGAGNVTVVLTVKSGTRRVLAQDEESTETESEEELSSSTVVVSTGSGTQEAVLVQQIYPTFQGALVVCPGADDPAVKLALTRAVSALTGLGADKISVCKGK